MLSIGENGATRVTWTPRRRGILVITDPRIPLVLRVGKNAPAPIYNGQEVSLHRAPSSLLAAQVPGVPVIVSNFELRGSTSRRRLESLLGRLSRPQIRISIA